MQTTARTATALLFALALAFVPACGSSGGGGSPAPSGQFVELGMVPGNVPTAFTLRASNPSDAAATVTDLSAAGPMAVDAGQFPLTIPAGSAVDVLCTFSPAGPGPYDETLAVAVSHPDGARTFSARVTAEVEAATAALQTLNVAYGDVLPGTDNDRTVTVSNPNTVTTVTVTGGTFPAGSFAFTDALPLQIAPGTTADLTLRYAPTGPGAFDTTATVATDAGDLTLGVTATTGGLEVIDLGTQTFDVSGNTPEMTFDIPADAIAFTVEGRTNTSTVTGLRLLMGPGDREYENEALTGPYFWRQNAEFHLSQVPNTDRSEVQLVAGGGTYRLKLWRVQGGDPDVDVRILVERRPAVGTDVLGTIDLNVFLANAIAPTAATAASDSTLTTVIDTVDGILAQQGLRIGDIDYYDVTDPAYDDVTFAEFGPMLQTSSAATETRLNLFFVREAIGGGILGVSAGLGGPAVNGTSQSGVMSLYSTSNPTFVGLVAAHEIGHFIGLAHTVEQNGSHDDILDTAECPATGTNGTCPTAGGGYLMHWQAVGGTTITDGQGAVIRGHPLVGPRLVPPPPLTALSAKPGLPVIHVDPTAPQNWCGTCNPGAAKAR